MRSFKRLFLVALLLGAVGLGGLFGTRATAALNATSDVACCQLTTSMGYVATKGQDVPGDEQFFRLQGTNPNVHFVLDTSGSMIELPQLRNSDDAAFFIDEPSTASCVAPGCLKGCSNNRLLADETARGYSALTTYALPDPGTGMGTDNGFPKLFETTKVYGYEKWDDNSDPSSIALASATVACTSLQTTGSTAWTQCMTCLSTKGFYHKPGTTYPNAATNNFVFMGNYLNFNPPKYVTARRVVKDLVANTPNIRLGLSVYDSTNGRGKLVRPQAPDCDKMTDAPSILTAQTNLINSVNTLAFTGGTPLGGTLLNVGEYFSSSDSVYTNAIASGGFNIQSSYLNTNYKNAALTSNSRSWCFGCQTTAVIIVTDGEPSGDTNVPQSRMQTLNGGAVLYPTQSSPEAAGLQLDDVAQMLHDHDLQQNSPAVVGQFNTAGSQSLLIYGIGLGLSSPILQNAAQVGGGYYATAESADDLKSTILGILNNITTRATSFSAASVSSLHVNSTGGAVLPRFRPSGAGITDEWQGFLYKFELGNEEQLTPPCDPVLAATILDGGAGDPQDLNDNGSCTDSVLIDSTNNPVLEDDQGHFVRYSDQVTPAVPYWEGGQKILDLADAGTPAWQQRQIWTVIDNNNDGKLDHNDTPIAFTEANADTLRPYLNIGGASGDDRPGDCAALASQLGYATATPFTGLICAQTIIRYVRGADSLNTDPTKRLLDRSFILGDIFHSPPVTVDPPTNKTYCAFGTQCIDTLYKTSTPLVPPASTTASDAYDLYVAKYGDRTRLVLVGANDGMLHAFQDGTKLLGDAGVDSATGLPIYNDGTGQELWAFIPPDLLPRFKNNIGTHQYYVDGSAMVRDVWLDGVGGAADGQKQQGEFRTVAVIPEGEGGVHRFALDLTNIIGTGPGGGNIAGRSPTTAGDFLWTWPQPCDPLSAQVGSGSGNFLPNPPPIGAVAIADAAGPLTVNGVKAHEQWIVMLNGGYDPYMTRGRGIAMVDLATGNTLWSMFNGDGKPNSDKMRYPFYSTVAMMDVGAANSPKQDSDLLFDTASVADFGGNIWTFRFWTPGPTSGGSNAWFGGRGFQVSQTAKGTTSTVDTELRLPITEMTANVLQPETGYLRTYVGTGDRNHLVDVSGPHCKLSNPYACAQLGCTMNTSVVTSRGSDLLLALPSITDGSLMTGYNFTTAANTTGLTGSQCAASQVKLSWTDVNANSCILSALLPTTTGSINFACDGSGSSWLCRNTQNDWPVSPLIDTNKAALTTNPQRFYGFWSFGVSTAKTFNLGSEASTYDANRFTDANLTDVTQSAVGVIPSASSIGPGWRINLPNQDEQTATGTAIVDGCVIWNTFRPQGSVSAICSTTGSNEARLYQASFASGSPNCSQALQTAGGWAQSSVRTVVAVPGEPTVQRSVIQGVASTGVVTSGAGDFGGYTVTAQKELLQSVYQLEISPDEHSCRHVIGADGGTACK